MPVATTRYAGGWQVAEPFAYALQPDDYTTHSSGFRMAQVSPQRIAGVIRSMRENQEGYQKASQQAMDYVQQYLWKPTVDRFVELALTMCEKGARPR